MSQANKNGILILSVQRGNEINIEYSKKEIINKINSYFGYKLVSEIKLQTFNTTSKKEKKKNILEKHSKNFEKKISEIENKDIRNSLTQLLTAVKND